MKTFRINKRYFIDAKNVRDAYKIYKKEIKDASISIDETKALCKSISSNLGITCQLWDPGYIITELYNAGDARKVMQLIKSKGYKVKSDGEMGFYISK